MWETNLISKKSGLGHLPSLVFLILVVIFTLTLYFYNNYLVKEIEKVNINISSIESNISEVEKEKSLQVYSLLELNKGYIKEYELMNKVTRYINHMNVIQAKYGLKFTNFNLSNWEIATNVEVVSDDKGIAYQKARDFIKGYRNDDKALFNLDFINGVEWMDNIKFSIIFTIK